MQQFKEKESVKEEHDPIRKEVVNFLKEKIPLVIDLDKQDIKYDKTNIYYKTYKYIRELEKNIKGDENK